MYSIRKLTTSLLGLCQGISILKHAVKGYFVKICKCSFKSQTYSGDEFLRGGKKWKFFPQSGFVLYLSIGDIFGIDTLNVIVILTYIKH